MADLRHHTPEPEGYDLVIIVYLHLPPTDRRRVIAAAARALAPSGTLLVIGHDRTNLTQGYGGPQDPDVLFSPQDVVEDLAGIAGVSIVRAERVDRPVTTDEGERTAIDALVRAVRSEAAFAHRPA